MSDRRKGILTTLWIAVFVIAVLTLFSCANMYQYASEDNIKQAKYDGKVDYVIKETRDSVYLELLDQWVAKDSIQWRG